MNWRAICAIVLLLAVVGAARADDKPQPPKEPPPLADDTVPMDPGLHHVYFDYEHNDATHKMTYGVYLPDNIQQVKDDGGKLPLVIFLCGRGSRGQTRDKLLREGPIGALTRNRRFAQTVDYIVVAPQVPAEDRWENERMGGFVAEATRRAMEHYPIDRKRVYLVGMSMGGEGVWHGAMAGPELYAVIVSVGEIGRAHV